MYSMKLIHLIIALLFSSQIFAQLPAFESGKIWKGLKVDTVVNNIARIRVENYDTEDDSIFLRKFWAVEEHVYENNRIDSVHFLSSRTDSISMSYFFDENGRIMGQRRFGKNSWYPIISYHYNEQELTTSEVTLNRDSTQNLKTIIKYNPEFRPILKEEFKADTLLTRYWIYEYDSCNNLINELYINTPNGPGVSAFGGSHEPWPNDTTSYQIKYDDSCQQKSITEFSNSELEKYTEIYKSGDTTISKTTEYRFDGEMSKIYTTKELDSLRIEGLTFLGLLGKPSHKSTYISEQLREYLSISYGETRTSNIYQIQYENDEKGNWVIKKTFENDSLIKITKRKIVYQ